MGSQAPAKVKYSFIEEALNCNDSALSVSSMCDVAGVSRSGYYRYIASAPYRKQCEENDKADFKKILEAYEFRGYNKGVRGIHMRLLHQGIVMNPKKIRRLMKKFGLKCPIRKRNPYHTIAKAMQTNNIAQNIVNRNFTAYGPRKVLLTDITYLYYRGNKCYLSTVLDAATREILSYCASESFSVDFVLETVGELIRYYGCELDNTTIIHSDRGSHYTSLDLIGKLNDADFVRSMSRKGNCWDNAPQESFFGHMKDEIATKIAKSASFEAVKNTIDDWIDYYNTDRCQWDLRKLTPREYCEYLKTGSYEVMRGSAPNPGV